MTQWDEGSVAAELLACEAERRDREPFTDEWPDLDVDTGYRIQDANLQGRLARGETLVGVKLGLTSEAKQRRMGVYAPFVAWLTDDMALRPGDPVPQHKLIHPRIEPEICFGMKRTPRAADIPSLLDAIDWIAHSVEIVQCFHPGWKLRLADCTASNGLHGRLSVDAAWFLERR